MPEGRVSQRIRIVYTIYNIRNEYIYIQYIYVYVRLYVYAINYAELILELALKYLRESICLATRLRAHTI